MFTFTGKGCLRLSTTLCEMIPEGRSTACEGCAKTGDLTLRITVFRSSNMSEDLECTQEKVPNSAISCLDLLYETTHLIGVLV